MSPRSDGSKGLYDSPARKAGRYLVFTSAGDHSNLVRWLRGRLHFDLWITYYGDEGDRYVNVADYYNSRKGSKFQNLKFAYETWPEVFAHYEAVMVMDDDVLISGAQIGRLFELRNQLDLWVLQPAFSPVGKISWDITRVQPSCRLRFTNFVEMTCPLFRQDKLAQFVAAYDPILVGFGMDFWFLHSMGPDLQRRVAVIDEIVCTNPHDSTKGRREIDQLQPLEQRIRIWEEVKRKHHIPGKEQGTQEFDRVLMPWHLCVWRQFKYACIQRFVSARSAVPSWLRRRPYLIRAIKYLADRAGDSRRS